MSSTTAGKLIRPWSRVDSGTCPMTRYSWHIFLRWWRAQALESNRSNSNTESPPEIVVALLLGNGDQGLSVTLLCAQRTHTSADHCQDRRRAAKRNPAPSIVCVIRATGWTNAR